MPKTQPSVFTFKIGTPEGSLRTTFKIPSEPMRLSDLARSVMRLDDDIIALAVKKHLPTLGPPSCKVGCTACCDQLIPISIPEAFLINDLLSAMSEARQEEVLTRVVAAESTLEAIGIDAYTISDTSPDEREGLLAAYHRSKTSCAFLEDSRCAIYASRPTACREYLVSSPPALCSNISDSAVSRVPISIRMMVALSRVAARSLGSDPMLLPLAFAIAWTEANEDIGQRRFDGYALMNMLLEEFSGQAA